MKNNNFEISVVHNLAVDKSLFDGINDTLSYRNEFLKQISGLFTEEDRLCFTNIQYFDFSKPDNEMFYRGRLKQIPSLYSFNEKTLTEIYNEQKNMIVFLLLCSLVESDPFGGVKAGLKTFKDKFVIEIGKDKLKDGKEKIYLKKTQKLLSINFPDFFDEKTTILIGDLFDEAIRSLNITRLNENFCVVPGNAVEESLAAVFQSNIPGIAAEMLAKFFQRKDIVRVMDSYNPEMNKILQHFGITASEFNVLQFLKLSLIHSWTKSYKYGYQIALSKKNHSSDIYGVMIVTTNKKLEESKLNLLHIALRIAVNDIHEIIESTNHNYISGSNMGVQETEAKSDEKLIFADKKMEKIYYDIVKYSKLDQPVLITGETGVGKDLIAREIHKRSNRASKPFLSVPIRVLSSHIVESELFGYERGAFTGADERRIGKFEGANGGTVYLPEISDLTESLQHKIMEFIQYKMISRVGSGAGKQQRLDVRLIFAASANIDLLVKQGIIREDFYYRLNVIRLDIPPLRERKDDIIPLAEHFLKINSQKLAGRNMLLGESATRYLLDYEWPGNVRELEHTVIRAIIKCDSDTINKEHLQSSIVNSGELPAKNNNSNYKDAERSFKIEYYKKLLEKSGGSIMKAAKISGLSRTTLYNTLHELGLTDELNS